MDYKEKLKEALNSDNTDYEVVRWIEQNFPELKESEVLKIKSDIQYAVRCAYGDNSSKTENILAWLDEQKLADKVEPKFKDGDWVTDGETVLHVTIDNNMYQLKTLEGTSCHFSYEIIERKFRLWTIQDAKDGDLIYVSTEEKGIQAIFHEYKNKEILFHCYLCSDFVQGGYMPIASVELVYPLQTTHYNRFFEKMKEAGYEWDADKKELKKIELQPSQWNISDFRTWQYIVSDVLTKHDGIGQYLDSGFCKKIAKYMQEEWSKKLSLGQNTAEWSEEDEYKYNTILHHLDLRKEKYKKECNQEEQDRYQGLYNWFKSLKNRVQPRQEWDGTDIAPPIDSDVCG